MPFRSFIVNRKSLIVLALVFVLNFSLITYYLLPTSAQQTPLEKAQSDYNFQFTKYRDAQEKYTSAKAEYESFKTATSKNTAFVNTRGYLVQSNKLYLAYISLIQENGNAINFTNHGDDKNKVNEILKNETDYFNANIQKINQTKTLEELPPMAKDLKTQFNDVFQLKLNKVLSIYEVVETEAALDDFVLLSRVLDRLVVFKLRAGETKSILNNWASEIKDIREKTEAGIAKARDNLTKTDPDTASTGQLQTITEIVNQAQTELKRSAPLFEEVARII